MLQQKNHSKVNTKKFEYPTRNKLHSQHETVSDGSSCSVYVQGPHTTLYVTEHAIVLSVSDHSSTRVTKTTFSMKHVANLAKRDALYVYSRLEEGLQYLLAA